MIMYVYGNIQTDARVKRAANVFANNYNLTLLSADCGVPVEDVGYKNVLLKRTAPGLLGYFQSVLGALRVIKQEKPDLFYAHDYYAAMIVRFLAKRKYCTKIIYDAHELIVPEKGHKDARMTFFYRMEKSIVNKVDILICASHERARLMKEHYHLDTLPFVVENISYLTKDYDLTKLKVADILHSFFKVQLPTIVYAGVVTKRRRLISLLDYAIQAAPKVKLLIVGDGDALEEMKEKASRHLELNACFTGAVPYEALGTILKQCDVGYLYYPTDTLNNTYCASNKIYEYASVGLPIVANANPTVKQILDNNGIGVSSDDINEALTQALSSLDSYKAACVKFVNNNSWKDTAEHLLSIINNL